VGAADACRTVIATASVTIALALIRSLVWVDAVARAVASSMILLGTQIRGIVRAKTGVE
jgi:hypothetical protein